MNVFFVDDEEQVLKSFKRLLQLSKHSYQFHFFSSAQEALSSPETPLILITDSKMPDISGQELIGLMREKYEDLTTILLTGQLDEEFQRGDYDYLLEKPCDVEEILAVLEGVGE